MTLDALPLKESGAWEHIVLGTEHGNREIELNAQDLTDTGYLADGTFGIITRVRWRTSKDDHIATRSHYPTAIVKQFKGNNFEARDHAVSAHRIIRGLGVKTWDTYVPVENKPWIFMTDGGSGIYEERIVFSNNIRSIDRMRLNDTPIERFPQLVSAYKTALRDAIRLGEAHVRIASDVWFLSFRPLLIGGQPENNTLHGFIGD